jgi:hypothetical protein
MKVFKKLSRLSVFIKVVLGYGLLKLTTKTTKTKKILIISSPRGGSTWLAQVLSRDNSSVLIDEPLFNGTHKKLKEVGIDTYTYLEKSSNEKTYLEFFNSLLNLDFFHWRPLTKNKINKFINPRNFVFKFINANFLIDYLNKNFKSAYLIFLIRNPYAVIASQLNHEGWRWAKDIKSVNIPTTLTNIDCYKNLKCVKFTDLKEEQVLAFIWCLNNKHIIFNENNNKKWITVTYESLISEQADDFKRIKMFINKKEEINKNLISSSTKGKSSDDIKNGLQLNKWKNNLNDQQIKNIHDILIKFDFDVYDMNSGMPKHDIIYNSKN